MKFIDCLPFRLGLCAGEFLEVARRDRTKAAKLGRKHGASILIIEANARAMEHCALSLVNLGSGPDGLDGVIDDWKRRMNNARAEGLDDLAITYETALERLGQFLANKELGLPDAP